LEDISAHFSDENEPKAFPFTDDDNQFDLYKFIKNDTNDDQFDPLFFWNR
jgi:hypothetical protein